MPSCFNEAPAKREGNAWRANRCADAATGFNEAPAKREGNVPLPRKYHLPGPASMRPPRNAREMENAYVGSPPSTVRFNEAPAKREGNGPPSSTPSACSRSFNEAPAKREGND